MKPCHCNDHKTPKDDCRCACHQPWNQTEPVTVEWLKDVRATMAAAREESERSYVESLGKIDELIREKERRTRWTS